MFRPFLPILGFGRPFVCQKQVRFRPSFVLFGRSNAWPCFWPSTQEVRSVSPFSRVGTPKWRSGFRFGVPLKPPKQGYPQTGAPISICAMVTSPVPLLGVDRDGHSPGSKDSDCGNDPCQGTMSLGHIRSFYHG